MSKSVNPSCTTCHIKDLLPRGEILFNKMHGHRDLKRMLVQTSVFIINMAVLIIAYFIHFSICFLQRPNEKIVPCGRDVPVGVRHSEFIAY